MKTNFLIQSVVLCGLAILMRGIAADSRPTYDHQTKTYMSRFQPISTKDSFKLTPFFSPDHSLEMHVKLIQSATRSVDILIPYVGDFVYCNAFNTSCVGCQVSFHRYKSGFPIWQALINAIHRGVTVRVLTNNYEDKPCPRSVTNLDYLLLAGADVRYYTSTTFNHAKYMMIDGTTSLVASINYSKASLAQNREAGVIIYEEQNKRITRFLNNVFQYDFDNAKVLKTYNHTISAEEMAMINDPTEIPITPQAPPRFACQYQTPEPVPIKAIMDMDVFASPDFALNEVLQGLKTVKRSFKISIYDIRHPDLIAELIEMKRRGIDLKIFCSFDIFGTEEKYDAIRAYTRLLQEGIQVMLSDPKCLKFYHQKYWIIDDEVVFMSTGNWANSDYPTAPDYFPAYFEDRKNWRVANRDFTYRMQGNEEIIARFNAVFEEDWKVAVPFTPKKMIKGL